MASIRAETDLFLSCFYTRYTVRHTRVPGEQHFLSGGVRAQQRHVRNLGGGGVFPL